MTTSTARLDPQLRSLALVVLAGTIMTVLDTTIVNVALNDLGRDLHTSLSTIQWVLTGYTLALTMTIPLTGWAVRRFGARRVWLAALFAFGLGSVLCGVAWSVGSLIAFRVLQGVGGGALMPVGQTMLAQAAGPDRMGRVMSVVAIPAMLAPVLGPVLGGAILDHLAWRWLFFINAPVCVVAVALAVRWLSSDHGGSDVGVRLDVIGLVLFSPGLAALVYGLSEAGNGAGLSSSRVLAGVSAGVVLLVAGVVHGARARAGAALIDVRLFTRRSFLLPTAGMFSYGVGLFGVMVLLPLYFQLIRGAGSLEAGLRIAPLGLGAMATMAVSGRLADRYGARWIAAGGVAVVGGALLVCTRLSATTSLPLLLGVVLVIGVGHGLATPPLMAAAYRGLDRSQAPAASTAGNVVLRLGTAIGPAVLAVVLQSAIRDRVPGAAGTLADAGRAAATGGADALAGAFGVGFAWAAGALAVALALVLAIPRVVRPAAPPEPAAGRPADPSAAPAA
ncbi:DHA2 family efflux MFS transporter permease subunit [Cryptosporangium phraense]|uniref:Multidrug efflux MFS transporter n=1 Tax=Cryptosporangium phraense TaxID=2593070 RepID=A0A545ATK6_9ACTN|nr:DHA2 family efflux MFS transporter permease subunit [Cryptosporangium phraense]TQS44670.1 multidrug efflux MFS transporter [Cryptosporangium phraense]